MLVSCTDKLIGILTNRQRYLSNPVCAAFHIAKQDTDTDTEYLFNVVYVKHDTT